MKKIYFLALFPMLVFGQTINPNFGNNGTITTDFANDNDYTGDLKALSNGKLLFFGKSIVALNSSNNGTAIIKYSADGNIDTTFGLKGKVIYNIDSYQDATPVSAVIQNDGKIIVAGISGLRTFIMRLMPNGTLDENFGLNGKQVLESQEVKEIFLDTNEKIIVVGKKNNDASIERLTTDGFYDTTFGNFGSTVVSDNNTFEYIKSGKILSDGSILCAGFSNNPAFEDNDVIFMKFSNNGIFDTTYGIKRINTPNPTTNLNKSLGEFQVLNDSEILILVGGTYLTGTSFYYARMYKLDLNGNLITSFGTSGFIGFGCGVGCDVFLRNLSVLDNQNILVSYLTQANSDSIRSQIYNPNGTTLLSSVSIALPTYNFGFKPAIYNNNLYIGYDLYNSNGNENDYYINAYTIDNNLAVDELLVRDNVIYPNPTKDYINIAVDAQDTEKVNVEVYSISGSAIATETNVTYSDGKQVFTKNLSQLSSGIYFVKIQKDTTSKTYKVIKN